MSLSFRLSLYLARRFFESFLIIFASISIVIIFSRTIEVFRATSSKFFTFGELLKISLYKYPNLLEQVLPFVILLSTMMVLIKMTRSNELVVMRSFGISAWQFIIPLIISSILISIFFISIIDPISASLIRRQDKIASKAHESGAGILSSVSKSGVWLHEVSDRERFILNSSGLSQNNILNNVNIFLLTSNNQFIARLVANKAVLQNGYFILEKPKILRVSEIAQQIEEYKLPTSIKIEEIQNSFASPDSVSIWKMPEFIETLKTAGFPALKHKLKLYSKMITPLLLCSMVLIAASFSLNLPRSGKIPVNVFYGILSGFTFYFFNQIISTYTISGKIPVLFGAIAPIIISNLIGIVLMLEREEG